MTKDECDRKLELIPCITSHPTLALVVPGANFLEVLSVDHTSPEITHLVRQSPDRVIAENSLLQARKRGQFHYDPHMLEILIDRIVECFVLATPAEVKPRPSS